MSQTRFEAGKFYQGIFPGGFTESTTALHVPGPVVNVDANANRRVTSVHSMPDPVQLPTHIRRLIGLDKKTGEKLFEEVPFDQRDSHSQHCDGIDLALQCGVIREVPDDEMQELYAEAWANRKSKIVFGEEVKENVAMVDLIAQFQAKRDEQLQRDERATAAAKR